MHKESYEIMKKFVEKYLDKNSKLKVLDVGSYDINGSYKDLFNNPNWGYIGLDIEKGPNVDLVAKGPYNFGIKDKSYDVIISGNCLEHVEAPWLWVKEVNRIIKKNGLICITTPFLIPEHKYPKDCWRILPNGMKYLFSDLYNFEIIECGLNDENSEKFNANNFMEKGVFISKIIDTYIIAKKNLISKLKK